MTQQSLPLDTFLTEKLRHNRHTGVFFHAYGLGDPTTGERVRKCLDKRKHLRVVSLGNGRRAFLYWVPDHGIIQPTSAHVFGLVVGSTTTKIEQCFPYLAAIWLEEHDKILMERHTASARDMLPAWDG